MQEIQAEQLLSGLTDRVLPSISITAVVTDSRKVQKNCVFVAIKGERVDGCAFAKGAVAAGAAFVVSEREIPEIPAEKMIVVSDVLDAMIQMGGNYRKQYHPYIIGVTGSVGKTTTKEFTAAVFSAFGKTVKTQGNQNNEIGMPNTLFQIEKETRYAVVEMGMQGLGEIAKLTCAAKPDAAVITTIGVSHLLQLGSRENICRAKMEICQGLPDNGLLVLNADDALLQQAQVPERLHRVTYGIENQNADVLAKEITQTGDGTHFLLCDGQETIPVTIPTIGLHNVYNAAAAYTLAVYSGCERKKAAAALAQFETTGYRQHLREIAGVRVLEDCYNANPDSMHAALSALKDLEKSGKSIAVLGDMLELGDISEQAHREVGHYAVQQEISCLITYGEQAGFIAQGAKDAGLTQVFHCETKTQAAQLLLKNAKAGDGVLFKGSRGMKMEEIMQEFYDCLKDKGVSTWQELH